VGLLSLSRPAPAEPKLYLIVVVAKTGASFAVMKYVIHPGRQHMHVFDAGAEDGMWDDLREGKVIIQATLDTVVLYLAGNLAAPLTDILAYDDWGPPLLSMLEAACHWAMRDHAAGKHPPQCHPFFLLFLFKADVMASHVQFMVWHPDREIVEQGDRPPQHVGFCRVMDILKHVQRFMYI
jgi:hypothetical protein